MSPVPKAWGPRIHPVPLAVLALGWIGAASPALAAATKDPCAPWRGVTAHVSPAQPEAGRPVRVLFISPKALNGQATWTGPNRARIAVEQSARQGPPHSLAVVATPDRAGHHRVAVTTPDGAAIACTTLTVSRRVDGKAKRKQGPQHWASLAAWDETYEDLYAVWIEALFDAPADETLAFRPLSQPLRDPHRNLLHNHLNLGEDDAHNPRAIRAEPDCADLPYFLRAYFAWKMQLPFAFRDCDRGTHARAPRCGAMHSNEQPTTRKDPVAAFSAFSRLMRNTVHSGSLRTALDDDETDFYPVPLQRQALRPGTVYADPYGHVLIISRWVPPYDGKPGLLFAVDGQPDASITRKRFWEGNFLFASATPGAGAGFKAVRPVTMVDGPDGRTVTPMTNAALLASKQHTPYSDSQGSIDEDRFFARMGKLINPQGLNPESAYDEMLEALVEQIQARVRSVDNGEQYMKQTAHQVIEMPEGPNIFETVGAWEDYATPSRDMRLLIAIKVLEGLPARVTTHPDLYALDGRDPADARRDLETRHARETNQRAIEYRRSDDSPQKLTVADVLARRRALEMAYNPNDCIEIRWGAPPDAPERATCQRQAPEAQRQKMESYRRWFADTRRPPRQ